MLKDNVSINANGKNVTVSNATFTPVGGSKTLTVAEVNAIFNNITVASTANDYDLAINQDTTINGLKFTQTSTGKSEVTVAPGKTLTITGSLVEAEDTVFSGLVVKP